MPRPSLSSLVLLVASLALSSPTHAQPARYRLTVSNTWSETTHPGAFPPAAHFSWIAGATHDGSVSFWSEGALASPGMVEMAETGVTNQLLGEVGQAVVQGGADALLTWPWWFCPADTTDSSCGPLVVEFDIDASHPRVTLVTMLGPSPDWFVGVSGLPLHDGAGWIDELVVDLRPYDGGTRDANAFALFGPLTTPPAPVSLITAASGQLVGPDSLGAFTFTRIGLFVDLGQQLTGDFAPELAGTGSLRAGDPVSLTTTDLPPARTAWFFLGLSAFNQPLKGGVLVPDPLLTEPLPTGPGSLLLTTAMPPLVPPETELFVQTWAPDPGGPKGACASNALQLVTP
jgi:hypothetical protein